MDASLLTRALTAAARAFLAVVDGEVEPRVGTTVTRGAAFPPDYDPLFDSPPVKADPHGSRDEKDVAVITYLGGIARINAEYGRGASSDEVSELAIKGGYAGGHSVNGWNSNDRAKGAIEVRDGARYLNAAGHARVTDYAERQQRRVRVVGDMTPVAIPESRN